MYAKNVVVIIDNLGGGGAQRQVALMARHWALKDIKLTICTFHQYTRDVYSHDLSLHGVDVKCFHLPGKLERVVAIRKFFQEVKPDLILSYLDSANILCCIIKIMGLYRSKLVVFDRHGLTDRYHFREFIKYFMYGLVANRTLVNSSDIYQKVRKRAPWLKGRLDLHWNAVSNVEQLDHENRTYPRSVSEKHIKLICAASYRELKNAHGLIEALAKINDEGLFEFTLNWYGNIDNPPSLYYEKLDQLVEIHGLIDCVRLNSFSSNIYSEIVKSDFVVLPSYFEGCPNFLIEGMFHGKPVLASNTSSNPEIVSDKGGFLFNPYDVDSIVHALQKAYNSSIEERKLMGEANRLQAETMFSIDRNLKKLYQVINMQL